jgi:hypothetical protein
MALMAELGIENEEPEAPKSRSRAGRSNARSTASRGARRGGAKSTGRTARH